MKLAHGLGLIGTVLLLLVGALLVMDLLDRHAEWSEEQTFAGLALETDSLRRELDIARRHANALANRMSALERACRRRPR